MFTNWNWKYTDYEISYLKNYINSYFSYVGYYQIKNNLYSILNWKRNNLEYLLYYTNTNNTLFHIMQFSSIMKIFNNNNNNNIKVLPEDYAYINKTIITNIFNKQWFSYNIPVYNKNNISDSNFITILDPNWKSILYNYCNKIKSNWKISTDDDYKTCIKFSNDTYILLKNKQLLLKNNKWNKLNYMFYEK